MLLRFSFSNFRSFRDEQQLSLIASTFEDKTSSVVPIPGLKDSASRVCGVYGANASGKTSVLRALNFFASAVRNSHRIWEPEQPIPLNFFRSGECGQSEFVLDFVLANVRYQYGFSATAERITTELLSSYPSGRKQVWFSRRESGPITFGRNLSGDNRTIAGLTRDNSLYLSAAAQNNHEMLRPIYRWISNSVQFVFGERQALAPHTAQMCATEENRVAMAKLLAIADLGIVDVQYRIEEVDPASLDKRRKVLEAIFNALEVKDRPTFDAMPNSESSLKLVHSLGADLIPFDLEDESDGTVAYVSLLGPIIRALEEGTVLVVDELDSSLHPLMARHLIQLFNSDITNPKAAQLIFNTHDTNLLARGLLRRDQIWFTEKDRAGASHLYPLTDFKPRQDENLQNGYLQGRYGAIPFIASTEELMEPTCGA